MRAIDIHIASTTKTHTLDVPVFSVEKRERTESRSTHGAGSAPQREEQCHEPHDRVQEHVVEKIIDFLVPHIVEETIQVLVTSQKRVSGGDRRLTFSRVHAAMLC